MGSLAERDGFGSCGEPLARFATALARLAFVIDEYRPVTVEDVEQLGSSWAKRLGIPHRRPAWLLNAKNGMVRGDAL